MNDAEDIQSKPFAVQMQFYMGKLFEFTHVGFTELAETLQVNEDAKISPDTLRSISDGAHCSAILASQLADALMIEPQEAVDAFIRAAEKTRDKLSLAELIEDYAALHNLKSERAKSQAFGIEANSFKRAKERGIIESYKCAAAFADKLCVTDDGKRSFFSKFSEWHYDTKQVISLLEDRKIGVVGAIRSLSALRGLTLKDACEKAGIARTIYNHWDDAQINGTRQPSREHVCKLMASNVLDVTERRASELMCEAAACFLDAAHVVSCLRNKKIDFARAVSALIDLRYPNAKSYAAARGVQPLAVVEWARGHIPRKELLLLVQGLPRNDVTYLMEQGGYFMDAIHINAAFQNSKRLDHLIDVVKETGGMTDDDFGVNSGTMSNLRNTIHTPRAGVLAKIYTSMQQRLPDLDWYVFKTTAARFMGIKTDSHEFVEFSRRIDAERKRLLVPSSPVTGAGPAG